MFPRAMPKPCKLPEGWPDYVILSWLTQLATDTQGGSEAFAC